MLWPGHCTIIVVIVAAYIGPYVALYIGLKRGSRLDTGRI
jgi:hypothetical protein